MSTLRLGVLIAFGLLAVSACSRAGETPQLMNLQARQDSPDEFSIVPTNPLQAPSDYRTLPTPTPGGTNLVDPDPRAEAVAALGGRPSAGQSRGVPAADAGLVRYAGRQGVDPEIRQELASEDLQLRQGTRVRPLERLFNTNMYRQAYEEQLLDPQDELQRWRTRGVRTPAAPPPGQ